MMFYPLIKETIRLKYELHTLHDLETQTLSQEEGERERENRYRVKKFEYQVWPKKVIPTKI